MNDWQRMSLYTESRMESLENEAAQLRLLNRAQRSVSRLILVSVAVLLGLAIWWIA